MAKTEEKNYNVTVLKNDKKGTLDLIIDRVRDREPAIINEYRSPWEEQKIEAAVALLKANPELLSYIEIGSKSDEPISLKMNENSLKMLKSVGIIDYTETKDLEQNQNMDNNEKPNPIPDKLHDEIENPEEANNKNLEEQNPSEQNKEEQKPDENVQNSAKENIDEDIEDTHNEEQKKEDTAKQVEDKPLDELSNEELDSVQKSPEYLFLTRERLINQIKDMKFPLLIEQTICNAYDKVVYVSELKDPNFLKNYLNGNEEAKRNGIEPDSFGDLHKGILLSTYVGYKMDNDAEIADDGTKVPVIEFPQTVEDMPQWLKSMIQADIVFYMKQTIERIMNSSNSYDALVMITPIDNIMDKSLEYAEQSNVGGLNSGIKKAYIKYIRSDTKNNLKEEFKNGTQDVDIRVKADDIDWTNPRIRRDMINMLSRAEKDSYKQNMEQLFKNVSFSIMVYSQDDVANLQDVCDDLKSLNIQKDVSVIVATDDPKERKEIAAQVDKTIASDPEIKRDYIDEEKINMERTIARALSFGAQLAVGEQIGNMVFGQEPENKNERGTALGNMNVNNLVNEMSRNERLMTEIASRADSPIEYMRDLVNEMIETSELEQDRQFYEHSYDMDTNTNTDSYQG